MEVRQASFGETSTGGVTHYHVPLSASKGVAHPVVEQYVGRLHVTMDDAVLLQVRQCQEQAMWASEHLSGHYDGHVCRWASL